ncbi:putative F-box protein At4g38870 [Cornus florida]|uniref:putative F-box protein At4g38870 n=1 Tax=Cornus florida TaxID=4283 RepID=UPI002897C19D|nr:putative F-box protein At4g38870 [Cornus florida]
MKKVKNLKLSLPEELLCEILKELPVKILLRFRCVSKRWCAMIDDLPFVQSHHDHSQTRPHGINILVLCQRGSSTQIYSTDPDGSGPILPLLEIPEVKRSKNICFSLQSVNGLVCVSRRIINPSTRECITLPKVKTSIPYEFEEEELGRLRIQPEYLLGYDPATKKHKVLNICYIFISKRRLVQFKILTLGTNMWRNINSVPNQLEGLEIFRARCIAGVIYCFAHALNSDGILAFEVGDENFRVMQLPEGVTKSFCTIEVRGHLALIDNEILVFNLLLCLDLDLLLFEFDLLEAFPLSSAFKIDPDDSSVSPL